jgi:hypothetical protein
MVRIEKTNYAAWPESFRITNGEVELVVTASAGPRIIHYGFAGSQNFFRVFEDGKGFKHRSAWGEWVIMGGHRLWAAPEIAPSTYHPDNDPVSVEIHSDGLTATPIREAHTALVKSMTVRVAESGSEVTVTHRIRNDGAFPVEIAAWVLTVMAQGGVGVTGIPPRGTHPEVLAPTNPLIMWAFTDLSDPRWKFTKKYLTLRQDPDNSFPQKLGHFNRKTWGAYLLNGEAFVKQCEGVVGAPYPDLGASFEIFANADFLELETLGPLTKLWAGESLEHTEHWHLVRDVQIDTISDETLDRYFASLQ